MAPALEGEGIGVTPVAALLQRHEQERQSLSA
jgi:ferredoxin-NADP reductase